ncbi:MAG: hypothetical protein IPO56_14655 [Flavobacteriales bacterium]|nr:hypothetical protein [Flavobacteriales bacterium]
MLRSLLFSGLLIGSVTSPAQNLLQRLQNDTMPNLVANPGFEETVRTYCSWTQDPAKFNANMSAWSSPTQTTPDHFSTNNDPDCWAHPTKHSKQGATRWQRYGGHQDLRKGTRPPIGTNTCKAHFLNR